MKYKISFLLFFFGIYSQIVQSQITVDTSIITAADVEGIIENVLIGGSSECAEVNNVTSSTGLDFGDVNGIGTFDATGTTFPFESGIILCSGNVATAPGPNLNVQSNGGFGWPGDADLEAFTNANNSNNASFIEFEFTPFVNEISFDFIMASEEYDQNFECTFTDAFAFILTDLTTGVSENLAVLPGTTTPIEVTNIHPEVPGQCPAINEIFFGQYNFLPFNDENTAATNYNGQTAVLTAMSSVIIGTTYNIKLVVADEGDTAFDIAVFLEAGSFNIGVDLGEDVTVGNNNTVCDGEIVTLDATVQSFGATYQWQVFNTMSGMFEDIPGETGEMLDVTIPGEYQVVITFSSGCTGTDSIVVEFFPLPDVIVVPPLEACDDGANLFDGISESFDTSTIAAALTAGQPDVIVSEYVDGSSNVFTTFPDPFTNTIPFNETITVTLTNTVTGCESTNTFDLVVNPVPIPNPVPDLTVCDDDFDGLSSFDTSTIASTILAGTTGLSIIAYEDGNGDPLSNPLPNPFINSIPDSEIVIATVADDITGCTVPVTITFNVQALPELVPDLELIVCDDAIDGSDINGFTTFNLTDIEPALLNGQTNIDLEYFATLADVTAGNPITTDIANFISNNTTIFVTLTDTSTPLLCTSVNSFDLIVAPLPILLNSSVDLIQCDVDTDGFAFFNLTETEELISLDFANETFTYFDSIGNPIPDPTSYMNITVSMETIAVTVTTVNGCERMATINLEVDTSAIPPDFLLPFEECDTDNDGIALFDFSSALNDVLALFPANQDILVSFHETVEDGQTGNNPIDISNYTNNLAFTDVNGVQLVWVRVIDVDGAAMATSCLGLGEHVQLTVLPNPLLAIDIPDFELCSDTPTTVFDLTSQNATITGGDPSVQVIYYANINDYTANPPIPIPNPTNYTNVLTPPSNAQTIYYSAIGTNGCTSFNVVDFNFEIIVNINPTAFPADPIVDCDDDGVSDGFFIIDLTIRTDQIQGPNTTGVTTTYHTTQAGAIAGDASIPDPTMYNATTSIIYARVTDDITGCFNITPVDITIFVEPVIPTPTPSIEVCDTDNDGIAEFVLQDEIANLNGGDNTLVFTFYLTETDAELAPPGVEIDQTTFTNNEAFTQIIYARVVNLGGCFAVFPITLQVLNTPILDENPDPILICDDDEDTFASFDLTTREDQILNGFDPTLFTFEWFVTLAEAEAGFPAIGIPTAFVTMSTTVYAVVTEEGQSPTTRCPSVPVALELIVQPLPVAPGLMERVEVCDDIESGSDTDGLTIFDLNTLNDTITGGDLTLNITYHADQASADAGTPVLDDPYTIGSMGTGPDETIFVRIEDLTTGCFRVETITLAVIPLPSPIAIPPVEECDNDGDGMAIFDLTDVSVSGAIINGEPIALSFHESEQAAIDNVDPVPDPSMYSASDGTILYVRAVDTDPNTTTECVDIITITLVVLPPPDVPQDLPTLAECDDDQDGEVIIDLTQNEGLIFSNITDPTTVTLTYHLSQTDAETNTDAIATSELSSFLLTASITIWIRVEDNTTGCFSVRSFEALLVPIPVIPPGPFTLNECDEPLGFEVVEDGIATFDLTSLDTSIIGINPDTVVTYFETQADVDANNPIDPADAYPSGNATIIAVLQSTQAGSCSNQTTVELIVDPLPTLVSDPLPDAIACDLDNDGFAMFDLDAYAAQINSNPDIALAFYETLEDALDNDPVDAIDTSVLFDNISMSMPQLYVVATDTITTCATIFVFNLVAHPVPVIAAPAEDISLCDDNDPMGSEVFDLTPNTPIVLGGQDPADFTVSYHTSQADADTGANPIMDPANFSSAGQTIYVRIAFNDGSDCFVTDDFELIVEPLPVIVEPTTSFDQCDDDTDEVIAFDLTTLIDDVTAGDPLLGVTFFASQDDVDNDNPITNPEDYENTSNPQTIQIVVNTLAGCLAQTQITLRVLPLPTPETTDPSDIELCDDDDDGMLTFDQELQDVIDEIIGDEDVSVLLYEDLALAELGNPLDQITLPYTNSIPGGQTIYARVESNAVDNFCFVIVSFDIIINPLPIINPDREDPFTFCSDNEETGTLDIDLATATSLLDPGENPADFTITYHNSQIEAENEDDPLPLPLFIDEQGAGSDTIFVRVENTVTGCFVIEAITVIVEASPLAGTDPPDLVQCADDPGVNGIPDQNSSTFNLTAQDGIIDPSGSADTIVEYFTDADLTQPITDPFAFVAEGETDGGIGTNTGITQQTIYATVTNQTTLCMSEMVSFDLFVLELPFTDLDDEQEICVDLTTGAVINPPTLDATPENPADGVTYTYLWTVNGNGVSSDSTISVTEAGIYQVTVTALYDDPTNPGVAFPCSYTASTVFIPISAPSFQVEVVEESFNTSGLYTVNVVDVIGIDDGPYEFSLDDGPFQIGDTANPSTTFLNVTPGEHTIVGRRVGGPDECGETAVDFGIIDFPRFFTPNGDGFNETWNIFGLGAAPNLNARVFIFNREGKLLKQLSPLGPGWDGTFNGRLMPSNDYWFKVEFIEPATLLPREFTNHFTLKR